MDESCSTCYQLIYFTCVFFVTLTGFAVLLITFHQRLCPRCMPPTEKNGVPANRIKPMGAGRNARKRLGIFPIPGSFQRFPGKCPLKRGKC